MKTLIAGALIAPTLSFSQCLPQDDFKDFLDKEYGEKPTMIAVEDGGERLTQIFTNPATGTYTIAKTSVHGLTCPVDSGHGTRYEDPRIKHDVTYTP
jgi:hypothetical protein